MNVNTIGVLYTAQAVGRQMERFKLPGSIILIASMSGSITNRVRERGHERGIADRRSRTTPGSRTILRRAQCCRWRGAWHANSDLTRFG